LNYGAKKLPFCFLRVLPSSSAVSSSSSLSTPLALLFSMAMAEWEPSKVTEEEIRRMED
jgi:hypothetical protein